MKHKLQIGIFSSIVLALILIIATNYIKFERCTNLNLKMKELNDNKKIIGLSKEEVVTMLGEPMKRYSNENHYWYNAGSIYKELILGNHNILTESYWYVLNIIFNDVDKVESSEIVYVP